MLQYDVRILPNKESDFIELRSKCNTSFGLLWFYTYHKENEFLGFYKITRFASSDLELDYHEFMEEAFSISLEEICENVSIKVCEIILLDIINSDNLNSEDFKNQIDAKKNYYLMTLEIHLNQHYNNKLDIAMINPI